VQVLLQRLTTVCATRFERLWIIKTTSFNVITMETVQPLTTSGYRMETMEQRNYDPDNLLASLIGRLKLKNDAALSRALEVSPPVISKIRHRRLPVTGSLLIRMHEVTDLSIGELRLLLGDRRNKFRISDKHFKPKAAPLQGAQAE
jgi:hypothetical protein